MQALLDWRKISNSFSGPIFCKFSKIGKLLARALVAHGFNVILRNVAAAAKIPYARSKAINTVIY